MIRAALYARYSSDQQSAAPIDDQLRICREKADREGWQIVGTYKDAAISGATLTLRSYPEPAAKGAGPPLRRGAGGSAGPSVARPS